MKSLKWFNSLEPKVATEYLSQCCASQNWVKALLKYFPFNDIVELKEKAGKEWFCLKEADWLEAFRSHPLIGDSSKLKAKFKKADSQHNKWSGQEQSQMAEASETIIEELAEYNQKYFKKFGFSFIICATGQSPIKMLNNLKSRIINSREKELINASKEQHKITLIRLDKMLL